MKRKKIIKIISYEYSITFEMPKSTRVKRQPYPSDLCYLIIFLWTERHPADIQNHGLFSSQKLFYQKFDLDEKWPFNQVAIKFEPISEKNLKYFFLSESSILKMYIKEKCLRTFFSQFSDDSKWFESLKRLCAGLSCKILFFVLIFQKLNELLYFGLVSFLSFSSSLSICWTRFVLFLKGVYYICQVNHSA